MSPSGTGPAGPPLVLVLVGTDHHPFDRLVSWADAWALRRGPAVRVVVQFGTAPPPAVAQGHLILPHADLQMLIDEAAVVVSHGGPATICEVRRSGSMPVVVPRDPALGEHVDGHQQRFARRMGQEGLVVLCEEQQEFEGALDRALLDPTWLSVSDDDEQARVARAVDAVGAVVRDLTSAKASGRSRRRVSLRVVRGPLRQGPLPAPTTERAPTS